MTALFDRPHGTKGRIVGRDFTRSRIDGVLTVTTEAGVTSTNYPAPAAHRLAAVEFTSAGLAGPPPDASGDDGLRSVEVCDAIRRSARHGTKVTIEHRPA